MFPSLCTNAGSFVSCTIERQVETMTAVPSLPALVPVQPSIGAAEGSAPRRGKRTADDVVSSGMSPDYKKHPKSSVRLGEEELINAGLSDLHARHLLDLLGDDGMCDHFELRGLRSNLP